MTAPLTTLPDDDAPLSEWLRPLSAKCKSARDDPFAGLGYIINPAARLRRIRDARKMQGNATK